MDSRCHQHHESLTHPAVEHGIETDYWARRLLSKHASSAEQFSCDTAADLTHAANMQKHSGELAFRPKDFKSIGIAALADFLDCLQEAAMHRNTEQCACG